MALTHKELPSFDVKDVGNGTAQFLVGLGPIEIEVRLDADQVDDLQSAFETVGQKLEAFNRAEDLAEQAGVERLWRQ